MKLDSGTLFVAGLCTTAILFWAIWVGTQLPTDSEVQEVLGSCADEEPPKITFVKAPTGIEEVCINNVVYYNFRGSLSPKMTSRAMSTKTFLEKC
jgi:hypothetical protein